MTFMNIKPLSQQNMRWRNKRLGTSYTTIGGYGCLITCASMLLNWVGFYTNPAKLNIWLTENGGYYEGNLFVWKSLKQLLPELTFIAKYSGAALEEIDESLAKGMPAIVHVDFYPTTWDFQDHWVLVIGKQGNSYIINDPKDGKRIKFEDRYGDPAKKIYHVSTYSFYREDF